MVNKKKVWIYVLIFLVVVLGGVWYFSGESVMLSPVIITDCMELSVAGEVYELDGQVDWTNEGTCFTITGAGT